MSIGRLIVEFEARTGKFETDTGRAAKIMEKRAREIEARATKLGKVVGAAIGAGIGAAATALTVLTKKAIDNADEMSKMSQKVGIATDQLSKLAYAAELADVDTESLSTSLAKLAKTAVDPSKDAQAAFESLGVSITDTTGKIKGTEQLIIELADAFAKFEDGPEKTAAAIAIFGKSGANMIPLLNGGAKAIRDAGVELERFGGVVTPEAGRAAEAFNDNLTRLKFGISGIGNVVAGNLIGSLGRLSDALVDTASQGNRMKIVGDAIAEAIKKMALAIVIAGEAITGVAKAVRAVSGSFESVYADLKVIDQLSPFGRIRSALSGETDGLRKAFEERQRVAEEANQRYVDLWKYNGTAVSDALRESFRSQKDYVDKSKELLSGVTGLLPQQPVGSSAMIPFREGKSPSGEPEKRTLAYAAALDRASESTKKVKEKTDEWSTSLESAAAIQAEAERLSEEAAELDRERARIFESTRTPAEEYAATIERLNMLYNYGKSDIETYTRAVEQAADRLDAANNQNAEKIKKTTDELSEFAKEAARNTQNIIADALISGFEGGVKGILRSFAEMIKQLAAQAVAAKIAEKLFGTQSSGGTSGGSSSSGWIQMGIQAVAAYFGGGRASGGPVSSNVPYMVGERGPELMVPKTAGTIVPNDMLGGKQQNIRIVNAFDASIVGDYLMSSDGEKVIDNYVRRNGAKIRNQLANG